MLEITKSISIGSERLRYIFPFLLLLLCSLGACATVPPSQPPPEMGVTPFVQAPPPPSPAELSQELPSGSLWNQSNGSLFTDLKAKKVGDILTITVNEESKGSKEATTKANRNKSLEGSFKFAGVGAGSSVNNPVGAASFGPYQAQFRNDFTGNGATARTDSMSAYMTATVVNVMPNGNLLIRGSRWTKVNDEMQQTVLEGVVRPMDITRNNTVLSQNIAEAKIFLVGKGPVTQHQKPGWFLQILDLLSPF